MYGMPFSILDFQDMHVSIRSTDRGCKAVDSESSFEEDQVKFKLCPAYCEAKKPCPVRGMLRRDEQRP